MELYTYWRSTAAYRVRIALALKNIAYEPVFTHLVRDGGEQFSADYQSVNPQSLVPALQLDDGTVITQSMAIIEYLEEVAPQPALLPSEPLLRAKARALCQIIACDIHPLNNLRMLVYLKKEMDHSQEEVGKWYAHWLRKGGLEAVEVMLEDIPGSGKFAFGDQPGMADIMIVAQAYNARRFDISLDDLTNISRIEKQALALDAFQQAYPDNQPDAELVI